MQVFPNYIANVLQVNFHVFRKSFSIRGFSHRYREFIRVYSSLARFYVLLYCTWTLLFWMH